MGTIFAIEKKSRIRTLRGVYYKRAVINIFRKNSFIRELAFVYDEVIHAVLGVFHPNSVITIFIEISGEKEIAVF